MTTHVGASAGTSPAADPPPRLGADEEAGWRSYLGAGRLVYTQVERELVASTGLTLAQYGILSLLAETPGHSRRMTDVAQATRTLPSALSHAAARLEESGWIERTSCPSDRRSWLVSITPAGHDMLEAATPHHAASVRKHLIDPLGCDRVRQLGELSEAILRGATEERAACDATLAGP